MRCQLRYNLCRGASALLFVATTSLHYGMTRVRQACADSAGFPRKMSAGRAGAEAWLKQHISRFEEEEYSPCGPVGRPPEPMDAAFT